MSLSARSQIVSGPTLGFVSDAGGSIIRPILGVPGASVLGVPVKLGTEFHSAMVSPTQNYVIAQPTEGAGAIVIDLSSGEVRHLLHGGAGEAGTDLIAISPGGSSAALYDYGSNTVDVIGSLPKAPRLIGVFDASGIPGSAASLAISDDGTVAIMRFVDGETMDIWTLDPAGVPRQIPIDHPAAVAFLPNRHDAVVADDATESAYLVLDVNQTATRIHLLSAVEGIHGFSSVATDADGDRVFLADRASGMIATVDVRTRIQTWTDCRCEPTGFSRLQGPSLYRLNELSEDPLVLLDATGEVPRIRIVPAHSTTTEAR